MAENRIDPSEPIPETDLLGRQVPLDPQPLTDAETAPETPRTLKDTVDEADQMEQQATVLDDDEDDYPHEPANERSS